MLVSIKIYEPDKLKDHDEIVLLYEIEKDVPDNWPIPRPGDFIDYLPDRKYGGFRVAEVIFTYNENFDLQKVSIMTEW